MGETDDERARNRAVVEAFFTSDLTRPEERIALWHDEGVKELPFAPPDLPRSRWEGRDEIVANTLANTGMFADCVHTDVVIHDGSDPGLFFVESRMIDAATFLGEPYPQHFLHVIRIRDGKVVLQQEYFDSLLLARAEAAARAKGRTPAVGAAETP